MDKKDLEEITKRLDVIIRLLSVQFTEGQNQSDQIKKLLTARMSAAEIAKLLGKKTNLITAYASKIKKTKQK